jgi:hypothetical protein
MRQLQTLMQARSEDDTHDGQPDGEDAERPRQTAVQRRPPRHHEAVALLLDPKIPRRAVRGEAVKKWDWLRAETAKTLENQRSRRCLSQFIHSLGVSDHHRSKLGATFFVIAAMQT